jgi:hypothetical protein
MNHLVILHYLFKIRALLYDTEKSTEQNYMTTIDTNQGHDCVDLFLKVARSNILTTIVNRDEIYSLCYFFFLNCFYLELFNSFIYCWKQQKYRLDIWMWDNDSCTLNALDNWNRGNYISTYLQLGTIKSMNVFSMLYYVIGTNKQFHFLATICSMTLMFIWF